MIGRIALDDLQLLIQEPNCREGYKAVVLPTHWIEGIQAPNGGIADVLGFSNDERREAASLLGAELLSGDKLVVSYASKLTLDLLESHPIPSNAVPPILCGDLSLMRAALESRSSRDYHIVSQGRLKQATIKWWFCEIRGIEVPSHVDLARDIMTLTSGMPLLVGAFDHDLKLDGGGRTYSEDEWQSLCKSAPERLFKFARRLSGDDGRYALSARERELLLMALAIGQQGAGTTLREDLDEGWSSGLFDESWRRRFPSRQSIPRALQPGPDDTNSLALLFAIGLLPHSDQDPASIQPGDSLYRIAEHL